MPPKFDKHLKSCLLGIPDHQGVMNVGGRIGAASGPDSFRKSFKKLKSKNSVHTLCADLGNLSGISENISQNHRLAADWIRDSHSKHGISVVVGGGHDHGYSHLWGIKDSLPKKNARVGCINIDAHLDVRKPEPVITSGSPFFLAIETGVIEPKNLIEFGIQSHCNGPELWEYVGKKRVPVIPMEKLRRGKAVAAFELALKGLQLRCDAVVISFDLDAVCEAASPGVSAPQSEGFQASEIIEMMEIAGNQKKVVSLGIFELNPLFDFDEKTARLAATSAYHFLGRAIERKRI